MLFFRVAGIHVGPEHNRLVDVEAENLACLIVDKRLLADDPAIAVADLAADDPQALLFGIGRETDHFFT